MTTQTTHWVDNSFISTLTRNTIKKGRILRVEECCWRKRKWRRKFNSSFVHLFLFRDQRARSNGALTCSRTRPLPSPLAIRWSSDRFLPLSGISGGNRIAAAVPFTDSSPEPAPKPPVSAWGEVTHLLPKRPTVRRTKTRIRFSLLCTTDFLAYPSDIWTVIWRLPARRHSVNIVHGEVIRYLTFLQQWGNTRVEWVILNLLPPVSLSVFEGSIRRGEFVFFRILVISNAPSGATCEDGFPDTNFTNFSTK